MKNDLLQLFVDSSDDFIYEIDINTNEILWYKDISKQLNFPNKTNFSNVEQLLKKITQKHKQKFLDKLSSKTNNTIHYEIKDYYGRYQIWEDKYIFQENKIIGVIKDISQITHELKEISHEGYKCFFEANKIPTLIISPKNGKILDANFAALNFYGYKEDEIRELKIYDINISSEKEIFEEMQNARKEQRDCFNFKHKKKNGKIIDVEVYSGPIETEEQTLLYSVIFDVSERKITQKKLMQASIIYQNTKEGIFVTDLEGKFLSVNKAFEHILGYTNDEIIGQKSNILKSGKQSEKFYKEFWAELKEKGQWEGEIINRRKNGEFISQWLSINTVYDEKHLPLNYISVFSDFTKLKEQEKLLRERDQIMFQQSRMAAMGEMLRNIAHQWRQPLAVISVASSGLKLKNDLNILEENDFEDFIQSITKSTEYLSDTLEDFTSYFRNENIRKRFKIDDAIDKTLQLLRSSFKNHELEINIDIEETISIDAVKNELVQVLLNILNNAKDAYKESESKDRPINIHVKREENNAIIELEDKAGGVKEEIANKIFDPYFTTKHQGQGTGISLYMCLEIVNNHMNGNIEVINIKDGKDKISGAKFIISIPIT